MDFLSRITRINRNFGLFFIVANWRYESRDFYIKWTNWRGQFNNGWKEAAKFINEINPEIAIPMHYEIEKQDELDRFKSLVHENVKVIELA